MSWTAPPVKVREALRLSANVRKLSISAELVSALDLEGLANFSLGHLRSRSYTAASRCARSTSESATSATSQAWTGRAGPGRAGPVELQADVVLNVNGLVCA